MGNITTSRYSLLVAYSGFCVHQSVCCSLADYHLKQFRKYSQTVGRCQIHGKWKVMSSREVLINTESNNIFLQCCRLLKRASGWDPRLKFDVCYFLFETWSSKKYDGVLNCQHMIGEVIVLFIYILKISQSVSTLLVKISSQIVTFSLTCKRVLRLDAVLRLDSCIQHPFHRVQNNDTVAKTESSLSTFFVVCFPNCFGSKCCVGFFHYPSVVKHHSNFSQINEVEIWLWMKIFLLRDLELKAVVFSLECCEPKTDERRL